MIQRLTLLALILLPCLAFGQFGINVRYQTKSLETVSGADAIQVGLEYHFRLKPKRVEFHPLLSHRQSLDNVDIYGHYYSIDFDFNIAVYPFDFEGDCNCPTFSKQGNLIKKGFFLEFQPGIAYQTITGLDGTIENTKDVVSKIGGAAGLDIGLSEHFTLTPFVSLTKIGHHLNKFGAGLRLTYSIEDDKGRRRH